MYNFWRFLMTLPYRSLICTLVSASHGTRTSVLISLPLGALVVAGIHRVVSLVSGFFKITKPSSVPTASESLIPMLCPISKDPSHQLFFDQVLSPGILCYSCFGLSDFNIGDICTCKGFTQLRYDGRSPLLSLWI